MPKIIKDNVNYGYTGTAGISVDESSNQVKHANAYAEQTTQGIYPMSVDAYGHVSSTGAVFNPDTKQNLITAGTGLALAGTKINHSNSVTANTTLDIYPMTWDEQGHVTGVGTKFDPDTKQNKITISTLTPSGGVDGDVWIQVDA